MIHFPHIEDFRVTILFKKNRNDIVLNFWQKYSLRNTKQLNYIHLIAAAKYLCNAVHAGLGVGHWPQFSQCATKPALL